jgi:hypothetical protein
MNLRVPLNVGKCSVCAQVAASQEGLSSTELIFFFTVLLLHLAERGNVIKIAMRKQNSCLNYSKFRISEVFIFFTATLECCGNPSFKSAKTFNRKTSSLLKCQLIPRIVLLIIPSL